MHLMHQQAALASVSLHLTHICRRSFLLRSCILELFRWPSQLACDIPKDLKVGQHFQSKAAGDCMAAFGHILILRDMMTVLHAFQL